jgi:hypothetical protein
MTSRACVRLLYIHCGLAGLYLALTLAGWFQVLPPSVLLTWRSGIAGGIVLYSAYCWGKSGSWWFAILTVSWIGLYSQVTSNMISPGVPFTPLSPVVPAQSQWLTRAFFLPGTVLGLA